MPYRVFENAGDAVPLLEKDDLVSRQSIEVRDGARWDLKGKVVVVEGAEDALRRAEQIVTGAGGAVSSKQDAIKRDLDAEGDEAAGGVGFIFG